MRYTLRVTTYDSQRLPARFPADGSYGLSYRRTSVIYSGDTTDRRDPGIIKVVRGEPWVDPDQMYEIFGDAISWVLERQ